MNEENESAPLFARKPFTLEDVSESIHAVAKSNFSFMLRKINQIGLSEIGDNLRLHKSNVSRMKDSGDLLKVAANLAAFGIDLSAMENEIRELSHQNAALQTVAEANLSLHKRNVE